MTAAQYPPSSSRASAPLDEITGWIAQSPAQLGVYSFHAARMMEREGLSYRLTFDRLMHAGIEAGLVEAVARTRVFRGFAAAAAGHIEPPAGLEEDGG